MIKQISDMKPITTLEELAVILDGMDNDDPTLELGFDMGFPAPTDETSVECGSACCIGGWINSINKTHMDLDSAVMSISNLQRRVAYDLCFNDIAILGSPTPKQGAKAIRNAIEFGDAKWEEVLPNEA
jgi:hypothetical protein